MIAFRRVSVLVITGVVLLNGCAQKINESASADDNSVRRPGVNEEPDAVVENSIRHLPRDAVHGWKKAGAEDGLWVRISPYGFVASIAEKDADAGDLPAFAFRDRWHEGALAKLPDPGAPFALTLGSLEATDAWLMDLGELAELKTLQALDLSTTQVTDEGMKQLGALKNLRALSLRDTRITDAGLKELAKLENLASLDLGHSGTSQITDAGMAALGQQKNLQRLSLSGARVTDAGVRQLTGLKNLQGLTLSRTKVTSAALKDLASLDKLQWFGFNGAPVEPRDLAGMKVLRELRLQRSYTAAQLTELQKALPACRFVPNFVRPE